MTRGVRQFVIPLLALGLWAGPLGAQEAEQATPTRPPPPPGSQFVFVNTQAILPQVPGAQAAQEQFNEELATYNTEVQELREEVDSLLTVYRQQEAMLSDDAKNERQQEIIQKQQDAQARASQLEQQATQRQQELLQPILERLGSVIEEVRAERNYTVVFDVSAAGVVAADPALDITPLVLERLTAAGSSGENPSR